MKNELIHETEMGDDDSPFCLVYEITPYDPGDYHPLHGGCPPTGGYAEIYEIRYPDGTVLAEDLWASNGFTEEAIKSLGNEIYVEHGENEKEARETAMEERAEAAREDGLDR